MAYSQQAVRALRARELRVEDARQGELDELRKQCDGDLDVLVVPILLGERREQRLGRHQHRGREYEGRVRAIEHCAAASRYATCLGDQYGIISGTARESESSE